jgi:hypothetical protein
MTPPCYIPSSRRAISHRSIPRSSDAGVERTGPKVPAEAPAGGAAFCVGGSFNSAGARSLALPAGGRMAVPASVAERQEQIRDVRYAVMLARSRPIPLRNHGGSCDAPSRLSSSSTTAVPTSARPRHGRAARRRCGGGSGYPATPSATLPSRLSQPNPEMPWPSASLPGMRRCLSAVRHRPSLHKPGGSVGSKRPESNDLGPGTRGEGRR